MRRLESMLSPLCAGALVCAALLAGCSEDGPQGYDDQPGAGTVAPRGGSAGTSSGEADGGNGDKGGNGGNGSDAGGGAVPPGGDSGAVTPLPGSDGGGRNSDASVACVIGSSGPLGLVPGGTMSPGTACVSCHASSGARKLNAGGTVYSALHEGDLCLGVAGGMTVVITDAQGADHSLAVNTSGNFYDLGLFGFSAPYTAKVVGPSGSVEMIGAQTNFDCNACHTSAGAQGAAGRIVGP